VVVCSAKRWVLMHEARGEPEPTLEDLIARMSPCDLLLIEGYKFHPIPKLEVYRHSNGRAAPAPRRSAHRRRRRGRTARHARSP